MFVVNLQALKEGIMRFFSITFEGLAIKNG